jgi:hypothetical protein
MRKIAKKKTELNPKQAEGRNNEDKSKKTMKLN